VRNARTNVCLLECVRLRGEPAWVRGPCWLLRCVLFPFVALGRPARGKNGWWRADFNGGSKNRANSDGTTSPPTPTTTNEQHRRLVVSGGQARTCHSTRRLAVVAPTVHSPARKGTALLITAAAAEPHATPLAPALV
jgi:hypothetical protein